MPDATKAAHYIQLLDEARCDDNWDAVPELIRKVRKHAPDRTCLTLTAEIEHAVAKANLKGPSDPGSSSSLPGIDPAQQLPSLLTAIENENRYPEDRFQARVCAGWLLWVARDYAGALSRLPQGIDDSDQNSVAGESAAPSSPEWTKVCGLKAAYLRANCMARDGQRDGALLAFEAALPGLSSVWQAGPAESRQQMRYWAELFLTEFCMLASQALREGALSLTDTDCLASFRTWARYWAAGKQSVVSPGGYGFRGSVPRRKVWAEYYFALSEILQRDLPFPTGYSAVTNEGSARSHLRAELKKVETIYQGLLFSETRFPRADEQRAEVEEFVRAMMENWAVLNGRGWKEHDLGPGGRDALCRSTLDALYGAAAKTYHSTAILRHMFRVHLAVAEFDLAFMAFDSWFELVKKGKARVQKTGHPEPALDCDATVLETISACISALCKYGGREAAEKARKLAEEMETLVQKYENQTATDGNQHSQELSPRILALAWQSIGLAQAQWARMTYESEQRASIQEKAIQCLRRSISPQYGSAVDVKAVFTLGVLYAEQRKLSAAVELVKTSLLAETTTVGENPELRLGPYWKERSLIPLWHLLALLLSARQEFIMAARACEGAIEQFKDPYVLFGSRGINGPYRSEHLNEAEASKGTDGIVDEMDDFEKEGILRIKMTQLAILELLEGPEVAVNASTELLSLYPRLFGEVEQKLELSTKPEPPKTAATVRTHRNSIFGSKGDKSSRTRQNSVATTFNHNEPGPSRPQTSHTTATTTLTIQTANGQVADPSASNRSIYAESGRRRSRNSLRKRDRSASRARAVSTASSEPPVPRLDFSAFDGNLPQYNPSESLRSPPPMTSLPPPPVPQQADSSAIRARSRSRSRAATNTHQDELAGLRVGLVGAFPQLLPHVLFSPDHSRRRRKVILVKVWLTIAGFYRRAELLEDAQKAIAEALFVAESLEKEVVNDGSGELSVKQAGWGMEKSVDEVLADVWAEMGHLSVARGKLYQARADYETALSHFQDHPGAIVGLSNILLDIYTEKLLPPPPVEGLDLSSLSLTEEGAASSTPAKATGTFETTAIKTPELPSIPLGLAPTKPKPRRSTSASAAAGSSTSDHAKPNGHPPEQYASPSQTQSSLLGPQLPPPHRATSLPLNDRLAARDRAYGLLSTLTRLGTGWNNSEAWLALARAYEESGQVDKARDALWWCVELEDGRGVREWGVVAGGSGYVL